MLNSLRPSFRKAALAAAIILPVLGGTAAYFMSPGSLENKNTPAATKPQQNVLDNKEKILRYQGASFHYIPQDPNESSAGPKRFYFAEPEYLEKAREKYAAAHNGEKIAEENVIKDTELSALLDGAIMSLNVNTLDSWDQNKAYKYKDYYTIMSPELRAVYTEDQFTNFKKFYMAIKGKPLVVETVKEGTKEALLLDFLNKEDTKPTPAPKHLPDYEV